MVYSPCSHPSFFFSPLGVSFTFAWVVGERGFLKQNAGTPATSSPLLVKSGLRFLSFGSKFCFLNHPKPGCPAFTKAVASRLMFQYTSKPTSKTQQTRRTPCSMTSSWSSSLLAGYYERIGCKQDETRRVAKMPLKGWRTSRLGRTLGGRINPAN